MRLFLKKLFLFIFPLVLLASYIEYYCSHDTTFVLKKEFLEKNKNSLEVLILGSSHLQNAINPEFLSPKSANLAFAGQPIEIDYYLLEKYIDQLPKLKTVFFEISPHSFYSGFHESDWNGHIYANLYHIYHGVDKRSIKNYSYLLSNFKFFSSLFFDYANPFGYKYRINKYGFINNDFNDRFFKLKNDSLKIKETFVMDHFFNEKGNLAVNQKYLENAIELCLKKNIRIILLTAPLFTTYSNAIPIQVKNKVNKIVFDLNCKLGVEYFDYSLDSAFKVDDFKNDNHLNSKGARKFTKKIDGLIAIHK